MLWQLRLCLLHGKSPLGQANLAMHSQHEIWHLAKSYWLFCRGLLAGIPRLSWNSMAFPSTSGSNSSILRRAVREHTLRRGSDCDCPLTPLSTLHSHHPNAFTLGVAAVLVFQQELPSPFPPERFCGKLWHPVTKLWLLKDTQVP